MEFNPLKVLRRRRRLHQAVEEEVFYLQRFHGETAYDAAMAKLQRTDLTTWGRRVVEGAAKRLRPHHLDPTAGGAGPTPDAPGLA